MRSFLKKFIGGLLVIISILSLGYSVFLARQIWVMKQPVTDSLISGLALVSDTLDTTNQALTVVDQTLQTIQTNVTTLEWAMLIMAQSIHDTLPMMDTLVSLTGDLLPSTITSTVTSLNSAQASAKLIDSMLTAVTKIPFFPGGAYNPEVPLDVALAQVAANIDDLQPSLKALEESLTATEVNLQQIEIGTTAISQDVSSINQNLEDASQVLSDYQVEVNDLSGRINRLQQRLPGYIDSLVRILLFTIAWVAIAQLGLLVQGLDLVGFLPRSS